MIDSILFLTPTGSGGMPVQDTCLILKKGEAFFKKVDIGGWKNINLLMVYTLTNSGSNQSVSSSVNYSLYQSSPESRIWVGIKNGNNEKLPMMEDSYFLGYGGIHFTSSLSVASDSTLIKIMPCISGSDVGGLSVVQNHIVTGSFSEIHSGSVLFSRKNVGGYSSTPYVYFNINMTLSGSNFCGSFSQTESSQCDALSISQSISNYVPRYLFPTRSINIPSDTILDGIFIKSPEFGPDIRLHGIAILRSQ